MKPVWQWLVDWLSSMLDPHEQDAILGDLTELGVTGQRAVRDLISFILAEQANLWRSWRPWVALFGIVGPVGLLLTQISFELSETLSMRLWVQWRFGEHFGTGLTVVQETEALACQSLAVIAWSWVSGFVLGLLSRRTIWITGGLFYLVWLVSGATHLIFPFAFDSAALPLTLQVVLFVLPSVWGMHRGGRVDTLRVRHTMLLAAGIATLTVLTTWTDGWWQTALEIWSEGSWHESVPWQERLLPFAVISWPAAYLLAIASLQQWREQRCFRAAESFENQKTN